MKLLVVEDEAKIADAIKRGLAMESYAVDVCYDGDSGLSSALHEDYDVIILDRMLPGTDGLTICQEVRAAKKHVPILLLTAKDTIADRVEGLNAGADDYLVKPFAFDELLARIRALMRRPKQTVGATLKLADLELNTVNGEVKRAGQMIKLSKKEYALLEFMMRNPGTILTKDKIINHVWDFDTDILPNTVEVYIGYLRKKIDRPFKSSEQLIHTLRGFGYKVGLIES